MRPARCLCVAAPLPLHVGRQGVRRGGVWERGSARTGPKVRSIQEGGGDAGPVPLGERSERGSLQKQGSHSPPLTGDGPGHPPRTSAGNCRGARTPRRFPNQPPAVPKHLARVANDGPEVRRRAAGSHRLPTTTKVQGDTQGIGGDRGQRQVGNTYESADQVQRRRPATAGPVRKSPGQRYPTPGG